VIPSLVTLKSGGVMAKDFPLKVEVKGSDPFTFILCVFQVPRGVLMG
jgi:hypothetical protein